MTLRIALILDGSSDAALRFPCEWLLRRHNRDASVEVLPEPKPRPNLKQRILAALKTEPNILLVHRDAEKETWESRRQEIQRAVDSAGMGNVVGVVPVRMTEAWFLIDENAIRMAADNPKGKVALNLPTSNKLENLPDPKGVLFEKLREASELRGRRLKNLDVRERAHRVAELINDYSPLLRLPAFNKFEAELIEGLQQAEV